jgi:hypothetical protein
VAATRETPRGVRRWFGTPIHPVLVAAYPVLFLLAENSGEVEPGEALAPLAVAVGLTLVVVGAFRVLGLAWSRAALVGSLAAAGVLLFGHFVDAVAPLRITEGRLLLVWLAAGAVALILVLRIRRDPRSLTMLLNLVGGVLVANTLVSIGAAQLAARGGASVPVSPAPATASPTPGGTSPPPVGGAQRDIYYLVVEDYGSPRTLRQYLSVPDDGFFDWLASAGFHVLPETTSNYGRTPLSMASTLNMTYLDAVAQAEGPTSDRYAPINAMVSESAVARFLKERGYTIAQLGSQYYLTAQSKTADVNPTFSRTSDFLTVLYESTIIPAVADRLGFEDAFSERRLNYEALTWQLATFPTLHDLASPKFVFMHLFLPHHPWIVDEAGAYVTAAEDRKRTPEERYTAQWHYVDREIKAIVEELLSGPDETDPIIVLSTDEGPNPDGMPTIGGDLDWSRATDAQLDQKFGIFAAYYLPGVDPTPLYPTMSSVNAFRLVFDLYFDAGLPLLPDRSFIHQDKHHPYVLTDVTERLPGR